MRGSKTPEELRVWPSHISARLLGFFDYFFFFCPSFVSIFPCRAGGEICCEPLRSQCSCSALRVRSVTRCALGAALCPSARALTRRLWTFLLLRAPTLGIREPFVSRVTPRRASSRPNTGGGSVCGPDQWVEASLALLTPWLGSISSAAERAACWCV